MSDNESQRYSVPFTREEIGAMQAFNRAPHPLSEHLVPVSEDDLKAADRITEGLVHFIKNSRLSVMSSNYLSLTIEAMLNAGEITREQFLHIHNAIMTNIPVIP